MHRTRIRAGLIAAVTVAALTGTLNAAHADDTTPVSEDAHAFDADEEGLFELQAPAARTGMVQPRNWTSSMTGWASGTTRESRHWADNDYTEIQFTGCTMDGAAGRSVGVKLWQAIPFGQDKDMGTKTFTNCFNGSNSTSSGEWNVHYDGGDNRYFTVAHLNGSESTRAVVSVRKVYVDTTAAD